MFNVKTHTTNPYMSFHFDSEDVMEYEGATERSMPCVI